MLPCHLYIFFGEACSDLFPIFKLVCLFSCSVLESSLYMLNTSSDLCFANIFSQSVVCLLTPLQENVFNLNRVQLTNFFCYGNSNTLATWCEELTHLQRPWFWERLMAGGEGDDRGWDGGMTEDEMAGWHHRLKGHGFGWTPAVGDGQRGLACCGSLGCRVRHNWATELNFSIVSKNSSSNPGSCRFSLASRSFIILHLNLGI